MNACKVWSRTSLLSADRSKRGRRLFAAPSLPLGTFRLCKVSAQAVDKALILVQGSNLVIRSYVISTIISASIRQCGVPCQPLCAVQFWLISFWCHKQIAHAHFPTLSVLLIFNCIDESCLQSGCVEPACNNSYSKTTKHLHERRLLSYRSVDRPASSSRDTALLKEIRSAWVKKTQF